MMITAKWQNTEYSNEMLKNIKLLPKSKMKSNLVRFTVYLFVVVVYNILPMCLHFLFCLHVEIISLVPSGLFFCKRNLHRDEEGNVRRIVHLCHRLPTLEFFQTCVDIFVLLSIGEGILKNVNRADLGHH